ncbi:winged helix-turn-helix transcriptional regulator [Dactylosporangium vinaceum]|uniref:Winged helix-turn-helix domain-containing protein n=1 Tax=Dactylosporangium vinaceum TaxID=53362 RepID=A0ABV5MLF2_9ACTN|nr:winged helix-turn-helix domain-containing protein [Dactylosporangium vinaceum]UAB96979.1 winged helix-turn-helix transcriptional regulator [Dactylosporangium vinaceum]
MEIFETYYCGYAMVAAALRREILDGQLAPGASLPSEKELTVRFECSRDMVRDALQVLRRELLIVSLRGRAHRVAPVPDRQRLALAAGASVIGRMPYEFELGALDCSPETPLLQVTTHDGNVQAFPADRFLLANP